VPQTLYLIAFAKKAKRVSLLAKPNLFLIYLFLSFAHCYCCFGTCRDRLGVNGWKAIRGAIRWWGGFVSRPETWLWQTLLADSESDWFFLPTSTCTGSFAFFSVFGRRNNF